MLAAQLPKEEDVAHAASFLVTELSKRENYVLFDSRDITAWLLFAIVFFILIAFDNFVLHRNPQAISFMRACFYCVFWTLCAACWNVYVYYHRGYSGAVSWSTGYLLEWML